MSSIEIETLVRFFKALADVTRLRIVGLLAVEERSVDELAALVDVRPPTVSHHLARLRELGLVTARREGNLRWYRLDEGAVEGFAQSVLGGEGLSTLGDEVEAAADDAYERKVLRTFMEDGRVKRFPSQWRKKKVLVRHIARRFEAERDYTEAQINEVIKPVHADFVTVRRLLVDLGWMTRDRAGRHYRLNAERLDEP